MPLDPLHVQISKNPDGLWNGGVYCGNLQRAGVPVAGGMHESARPSVDTSVQTRLGGATQGGGGQGYVAMALGGMQTHQAPTTSKDMTHQQKQSLSVEGCGSAIFDSVWSR